VCAAAHSDPDWRNVRGPATDGEGNQQQYCEAEQDSHAQLEQARAVLAVARHGL
jgi:hypothetical protein